MPTSTRLGPWLVGTVREGSNYNLGATTVSQEAFIYQPTAASGNAILYRPGVGGAGFIGNNINIPNIGSAYGSSFFIPAGSRIQGINAIVQQIPGTVTGGSLTFSLGSTTIGTITLTSALGVLPISFGNSLATLRAIADVGPTDVPLTVAIGGTFSAGQLLIEISTNYTVRNPSGTSLRLP